MKVSECRKCGRVRSEWWRGHGRCPECGLEVDHLDEKLGPREMIPRVLKWGAILLLGVSLFLIAYGSVSGSDPEAVRNTSLLIILASAVLLTISLAYGHVLSLEAVGIVEGKTRGGRRPSRSVQADGAVRGGRVPPVRGRKMIIGKR